MKKIKLKNLSLPALLVVFAGILIINSGCNDKPTDLGYSIVCDTVAVKTLSSKNTAIIKSLYSYPYHDTLFHFGTILVGSYKNYKAFSFLRFKDIPDTLDYLTESGIVSAKLTLYPNRYTFGDSLHNRLAFNIFKVIRLWTNHVSNDSVSSPTGLSNYVDTTKILGSYSGIISLIGETPYIEVDIDKSLMVEWFKMQKDTTLRQQIWGIALLPDANSSVIRQFFTQSVLPNSVTGFINLI
jgi:hypothetical protein